MPFAGFVLAVVLVVTSVLYVEAVLYLQELTEVRPMLYVAGALALVVAVGAVERHTDRTGDPPDHGED